ncbi:uncharacterized protein LOC130628624 [Hydractinia symbiolongicarpus]|uniref:uncharacterized protein LOC130628624 n=1 Tax=Hydractinia symbiolongicarpus TaxID=13093 RepID=UPI00254A29B7|nr:uncharacterized protein LOC130628624 [Hydractinia symbiolongicarpus]
MVTMFVVLITIFTLALILHLIGFFLLYNYSGNISKTQKKLMLNLSITEIILSCLSIMNTSFTHITLDTQSNSTANETLSQFFVYDMACTVTSTVYFAVVLSYYYSMTFLTLDRLCEVYLNIRYSLYWSARKTKYLTLFMWVIIVVTAVGSTAYALQNKSYHKMEHFFYYIIYPTSSALFFLVGVPTYTYIIIILLRNERRNKQSVHGSRIRHSSSSSFSSSFPVIKLDRILLPLLLMVTFILFLIVPHILIFNQVITTCVSTLLLEICHIMLGFGFMSDVVIYVLFSTSIRKKIIRQMKLSRRFKTKINEAKTSANTELPRD